MSEFTLDENGKISDSDPIYKQLDEWYDAGDYDGIISAVLKIPRGKWSNTLHFRLISAYNNKKDFDSSLKELQIIHPACESPVDLAKFYYMSGYMYFMTDKEMLALSLYKLGLEADPQNVSGLDLEDECRDCLEYINEDLNALHAASADAVKKIAARCAEKPDKIDAADPDFTLRLGALARVHVLPGMKRAMGVDVFDLKYEGEERETVLKCLAEYYHITDRASFMEFIKKDRYCNLASMADDVMARLSGKPNFDPDILNRKGREAFDNSTFFVRPFAQYLPKAGVLAWDINEKMWYARYAYSCDLLPDSDYREAMLALSDTAKANFSSSEEYLRSMLFGSVMYAFDADDWNIGGAVETMGRMLDLLLQSDLPDIKWKRPEKSRK